MIPDQFFPRTLDWDNNTVATPYCKKCYEEKKKEMHDLSMEHGGSKKKPQNQRKRKSSTSTVAPASKRGRVKKKGEVKFKKGEEVEILYDDVWWGGVILLKHTKHTGGGYKVKYHDDEGCEQEHVPGSKIRYKC